MVEPIGGGASRYAPGKGWGVVVDSTRGSRTSAGRRKRMPFKQKTLGFWWGQG